MSHDLIQRLRDLLTSPLRCPEVDRIQAQIAGGTYRYTEYDHGYLDGLRMERNREIHAALDKLDQDPV